MKSFLNLIALIFLVNFNLYSQAPTGYYNSANGLTGTPLQQALHNIIKANHDVVSYDGLWTRFDNTDLKPSTNLIWDMYTDIPGGTTIYNFTYSTDQCGEYTNEGDCYNREHSFPQVWFNGSSPMYSDLFHLYPTDGKVNGIRSNYPFGEVGSASITTSNGSKLGSCSYPGYSGTVFEPIDAYKGDFARTYFYMATRYYTEDSDWATYLDTTLSGSVIGSQLKNWALKMMLEWNAADPVSQKEIDRNNSVYAIQFNRNPFIDNAEYANLIWGTISPTIYVNPNTISNLTYVLDNGPSQSQTFAVSGSGLTSYPGNITLTAPTNFEISKDNSTFSNSLTINFTSSNLATTTIYVRLKAGLSINTYLNQNITISGGGATNVTVTCNGSVTDVSVGTSNVIITEFVDASSYLASYVEIHNAGSAPENITGWQLFENGVAVATVTGVTLQPCDYLIFIRGTLTVWNLCRSILYCKYWFNWKWWRLF